MPNVWYFFDNNARMVCQEDSSLLFNAPCIVDPDLTLVRGIPPHLWKLVDGVVVPLEPEEVVTREQHIAVNGACNGGSVHRAKAKKKPPRSLIYAVIFALGVLTSYFIRSL